MHARAPRACASSRTHTHTRTRTIGVELLNEVLEPVLALHGRPHQLLHPLPELLQRNLAVAVLIKELNQLGGGVPPLQRWLLAEKMSKPTMGARTSRWLRVSSCW